MARSVKDSGGGEAYLIVYAKLPNSRFTTISDPTQRGREVSGFGVLLRNNHESEVFLQDP